MNLRGLTLHGAAIGAPFLLSAMQPFRYNWLIVDVNAFCCAGRQRFKTAVEIPALVQARTVTVRTAILMSDVLGNSAEFWLNCQRTLDIWQTLKDMGRLEETVRNQPSVVAKKRASVKKVKESPKKAYKTPGARKATRKK